MTLPDERYRAVMQARELMYDLCDPKKTPGVSRIVRERARGALRHYPGEWELNNVAVAAPDIFAQRMEPVTRLFKQYEESKKDQ